MKKYIAAVSGGPDSMAMLGMYKKQILAVCHVNYNKRKTAKRDEMFVKNFCKKNNINFFKKKIFKPFYWFHKKENFQNLARQIRYDFFVEIGNKLNCQNLLVAHTLDDFIETAYLQKKKKTKTLFFGIKQHGEYKNLKIFRPLIDKRKTVLTDFCIEKKIEFGIDETNSLEIYERNKIRKEIEKWSDKKFSEFVKIIKKNNKENAPIELKAKEIFEQWKKLDFETNFFLKIKNEIKSEIIKYFFRNEKIKYRSSEKFSQVIDFIENGTVGKMLRVGNGKNIKKQKNNILCVNNIQHKKSKK